MFIDNTFLKNNYIIIFRSTSYYKIVFFILKQTKQIKILVNSILVYLKLNVICID